MDIFSSLISIFSYVGVAYGLMCIGQTCGLKYPWLSWIPFANVYQLGVVADHYMARNENRQTKQRTTLLVLYIVFSMISAIAVSVMFIGLFKFFTDIGLDFWRLMLDTEGYEAEMENILATYFSGMTEDMILSEILGMIISILLPLLIILPVSIVYLIFYIIALHRIYKLMDPKNATIYTVLSVLFNIATPIIFLIIAKKQPIYPSEGPFFGAEAATVAGSESNDSGTYSI